VTAAASSRLTTVAAGAGRWLPWIAFAVAGATVAVGLYVRRLTDTPLGAPYPPSFGDVGVHAHPLLVVSLACFAAAVGFAPRVLDERVRPATLAGALFAGTLVLRLALAAGRGGTSAWDRVFDVERSFEAKNEYLPALPALDYGPRFFLDRFAELVPSLPVHAAGHPPGLLLVMDGFGITTPGRLAALCIVMGALSAPLTYGVARRVLDERGARLAGLLMALSPQALRFGVTSADALFLTVGLLAAWPLAIPAFRARLAGAAALAVASLFAWSLLAIGAWAAVLALRREGRRQALALSVLGGAVLVTFHAALAAVTGFDPIGTIAATGEVYRAGVASIRPYWYWVLGSPVGFLVVLGLPIFWLALRGLASARPEAVAIFAVLAIASVLGFTKAETERIWLFFAPFVCLAAAGPLAARPALLRAILATLAVQAVLHELLFDPVW